MAKRRELPLTEELDFQYLLGLMPPLHNIPEFSWLPELFSIIGHEKLITLCKYAGGESITIPTLDQLNQSIDALQWFYDVRIQHKFLDSDVPPQIQSSFLRICEVYDARNSEEVH